MFTRKSKPMQTDDNFLICHYRKTATEQQDTIDKQDELIKRQDEALRAILQLTEINTYGNVRAILGKIKELAKTQSNTSSKQD